MEVIFRKSTEKHSEILLDQIEKAKDFLLVEYPEIDFEKIRFIFGQGRRSMYYRNKDSELPITIHISCRAKWATYEMKRLKLYANWIFVGIKHQATFALVHELTHHIQYELGLPIGESLTTKHELLYCKERLPNFYKKLKKI